MSASAPPGGALARTTTKDRLVHEKEAAERQVAEMQAQMQAQMAQMQTQMALVQARQDDRLAQAEAKAREADRRAAEFQKAQDRPPNIKQLLDSAEWRTKPVLDGQSQQWWGTGPGDDRSFEVNRLRALAKVRRQWPKDTFPRWPQLVVIGTPPSSSACSRIQYVQQRARLTHGFSGDGNTGKSTVLNRFAQFNFSTVSKDICTRRPIRLKLRPMSNRNRQQFTDRKLDAIVQLHDTSDGFKKQYDFRTSHRVGADNVKPQDPNGDGPDEDLLRYEVQDRASRTPPQRSRYEEHRHGKMTSAEEHDSTYSMDELIIRYEAPGMIHFDLVDLPGIENGSQMTHQMVEKYLSKETLAHTFMLIFQSTERGDTRMQFSLCLQHILRVAKDAEATDSPVSDDWLKTHCLGVITMFDKKLENNSPLPPDQYNAEAAKLLNDWLTCAWSTKEPHLKQFDWVVVLNPNPNETKANMSFAQAYQKESWFFDTLFAPIEEDWAPIDPSADDGTKLIAPQPEPEPVVVGPLSATHSSVAVSNPRRLCGIDGFRSALIRKYADFATTTCLVMAPQVFTMVIQDQHQLHEQWGWTPEEEHFEDKQRLIGVLASSVTELLNEGKTLNPQNVLVEYKKFFAQGLQEVKPARSESNLKVPVDNLIADLTSRCDRSSKKNKFKRFPLLMHEMGETTRVVCGLCKDYLHGQLAEEVLQTTALMKDNKAGKESMVPCVVAQAQKNTVQMATWIEQMPVVPINVLSANPAAQLSHAATILAMHSKDKDGKFGLKLGHGGRRAGLEILHDSPRTGDLPIGATILEVMGRPVRTMDELKDATSGIGPNGAAFITYSKSPNMIDVTNHRIADWLLPQNLDKDYLQKRNELMKHRRACELLRLVFDEDLQNVPARVEYDRALVRPLVRLGKWKTIAGPNIQGAEIAFQDYLGKQLSKPSFADKQHAQLDVQFGTDAPPIAGNMKSLPGFCSTPGCLCLADAACHPCGHCVCCWDCINEIKINGGAWQPPQDQEPGRWIGGNDGRCPVCNVPIASTFLCYE
jgi:hypothetical protein|eukprot:COSAG02_NODE_2838_length_7918_cov_103.655710_7_plen_1037_part_00